MNYCVWVLSIGVFTAMGIGLLWEGLKCLDNLDKSTANILLKLAHSPAPFMQVAGGVFAIFVAMILVFQFIRGILVQF